MALDKILKIYDENGNEVDYDILANDVKFQDGVDLPTKIAEMEEDISEAGTGNYTKPADGIPATDLDASVNESLDKADTAYQKPASGIPSTDMTQAVQDALAEAGTAVQPGDSIPASDVTGLAPVATSGNYNDLNNKPTIPTVPSDIVQSISVNGGAPTAPDGNGNVNITVGGGTVESVTVNGTPHYPDTQGDVDLGNLRGQDGNSGVASADGVESVNNLNGGTVDTQQRVYVLGANQGKRLRDQIDLIYQRMQSLYSLLGNIAFWDGKPNINAVLPSLDWGNPRHNVTLSLNLSNAVVTRNGVPVSNTQVLQVEEFSTLTLIVAGAQGYALASAPTVSVGGNSITPVDNGDYTYTVELTMGQVDIALTIAATGTAASGISYSLANIKSATRPTVIFGGGTASITIEPEDGYRLSGDDIVVTGATKGTYANNVLTISNPTGDVTISASAVEIGVKWLRGYWYGTDSNVITNDLFGNFDVTKMLFSDYIQIPQDSALRNMVVNYGFDRASEESPTHGGPAAAAFFVRGDNGYEKVAVWSTAGANEYREFNVASAGNAARMLAALQNGNLYVRIGGYLTTSNGNTIVSSCHASWNASELTWLNGTVLFKPTDAYTIVDDPNEFEPYTV